MIEHHLKRSRLIGHETTAHTLTFTSGLLAINQGAQEKLYQEIMKVVEPGQIPVRLKELTAQELIPPLELHRHREDTVCTGCHLRGCETVSNCESPKNPFSCYSWHSPGSLDCQGLSS